MSVDESQMEEIGDNIEALSDRCLPAGHIFGDMVKALNTNIKRVRTNAYVDPLAIAERIGRENRKEKKKKISKPLQRKKIRGEQKRMQRR